MTIVPSPLANPHLPRSIILLVIFVLLGGCAAYGPTEETRPVGPPLKEVRGNPDAYSGALVRWGGSIARVENRRDETWIEIVEYPLDDSDYPQPSNASEGRFIARIPGFLDPAIYAEGRLITVTGALESTIQRPIGEYPYTFPVVAADRYQLWEKRRERTIIYYDPYDYWWPYSHWRYPFYRRW